VGACADCGSGRRAARAEARANERVTLVQEQVAENADWLGACGDRSRATPTAAKVAAVARRVTTWVTTR
jgi:hypothetical protein